MLYQVCYLFLLFFIFSVLGYIVEIISCSIHDEKIVLNRGFCLGPYLPIYGVSSLILIYYLAPYRKDPLTLFVMSSFICTFLEYMTSYILEKIFKARWWDYSEKKFQIGGRVCLENACLFGIGGLILLQFIFPVIHRFLLQLNENILIGFSIFLFSIFFLDLIITIVTLCQVKVFSLKFKRRDATEEISKRIRTEIIKNKTLIRRMLNAFPLISKSGNDNPLGKIKSYLDKKHKTWKEKQANKNLDEKGKM